MEEEYLPTHKRKPWCLHVSQHVLKIGNEELSLSLSLSLSPYPRGSRAAEVDTAEVDTALTNSTVA